MEAGSRLLAAIVAVAFVATAIPAAAVASPSQQSIVMDDNLLLYRGEKVATATVAELKSLGVDRVRVNVLWKAIAPYPKEIGRASCRERV